MKLLNREYAPSKHSSGYLKVNNPNLAARYVFKAGEVVDEVSGLTTSRLGNGGVRLPVPDLNAGYSVRVAYNTLGSTANSTVEEILRIGNAVEKAFAVHFVLSKQPGVAKVIPALVNQFEVTPATGVRFTANSGTERVPSGLQILEFNARGAVATKDVAADPITSVVGTVGEYFKVASRVAGFGQHLYVNPEAEYFLTTEFASANCQIVFIEVYKPKAELSTPSRSLNTNHSHSYFGALSSDPAVLPNLKCNIGVFDGAVVDSTASNIGTYGATVARGFIDLSLASLKLAPTGEDLEWTCKFVAVPESVEAETTLLSVTRGQSTLNVMLNAEHRISIAGQSVQLHANGKYDIALVGLNDTILVYVDGVLRLSGALPITYPIKACEIELKSGLSIANGVQYYDCALLNSTQMLNSAVTKYNPELVVHSAFDNENASIDFAQGRDTGLNPVPFNLLLGTTLTAFRIPNVPKAPVVGISANVTLFSTKNSNGNVTCKLTAVVNGLPLEFAISLSGHSLGEVGFALTCGSESITRWLKMPAGTNGFGDWETTLQLQACNGSVIATVLGRSFVVNIPDAPLYDLREVSWYTSQSAQPYSSATAISVHKLVTYTGDDSLARKVPSFLGYSAELPSYSAEKFPTLVMAFGVDKVELVTGTTLPETPYLSAQERYKGLLISATNIGNITCAVPDLTAFTMSLTFIPTGSQWVSLTLGALMLTLNSNSVRIVAGDLDVTGNVVPYVGPRDLVVTYTGTELVATVNDQEIVREPYSEVFPGTTNLGMNSYGQGSFTLVDFRLHSSAVAAVPWKQLVLRARQPADSDVTVGLSAIAVTQSEPNGLGPEVTVSPGVYSLLQTPPVVMDGAEVTVASPTMHVLAQQQPIIMEGARVTVSPATIHVLIAHEA